MKKTTKILIVLAIISIMPILSGCSLNRTSTGFVDVHTGTEGLSLNFLEGLPPSEIFAPEQGKTSPFQIILNLKNNGATDIESGYIVISIEKDYMNIKGWDIDSEITPIGATGERTLINLKGRSQINPMGEERMITVNAEALSIDKQTTYHTSSTTVTACYMYETELDQDICIDTDIYNTKPTDKSCTVSDISVSGGQGAPVEITSIEEKVTTDAGSVMPMFIIHVKNSGNGEVVSKDKVSDACSSLPLGYESMSIIDVDEVKFSTYSKISGQMECSPEKIRLKGGEGIIRCSLKSGLISSKEPITYTTPLYIQLSYGYMQSISKETSIKRFMD